jgi:hypothetical protein
VLIRDHNSIAQFLGVRCPWRLHLGRFGGGLNHKYLRANRGRGSMSRMFPQRRSKGRPSTQGFS